MKKLTALILAALLALSMLTAAVAAADKDTVKQVQQALNDAGYSCGTPDGVAGKKTAAAISQYQTDNGLEATGQIDDALLEALGIATEAPEAPAEAPEAPAEEPGQADTASSEDAAVTPQTFEEAGIPSPVAIQDPQEVIGEWTVSSIWLVNDDYQEAIPLESVDEDHKMTDFFGQTKMSITDELCTIDNEAGELHAECPWNLSEDGGIEMPRTDGDGTYTIYLCDDGTIPYDFYLMGMNVRVFLARVPEA